MALSGHRDRAGECPLLGGNSGQTPILARDGLSAYDPNVWSGRALQVDFAELAVSGLASMYPASDWSVLCSGPSWISARVRSHERKGLERAIWVTSVRMRREDRTSISSHPLADLGG